MDINIITYLACICFIFIFGKIFIVPIKKILKLVINSILGGITIYIINFIGAYLNFHIGLNFLTSVLIRIIRITRSCMLNCCTSFGLGLKKKKLLIKVFSFLNNICNIFFYYSTVLILPSFLVYQHLILFPLRYSMITTVKE